MSDGPSCLATDTARNKSLASIKSILIGYLVLKEESLLQSCLEIAKALDTDTRKGFWTSPSSKNETRVSSMILQIKNQDPLFWFYVFTWIKENELCYVTLFQVMCKHFEKVHFSKEYVLLQLFEVSPFPEGRWFILKGEKGKTVIDEISKHKSENKPTSPTDQDISLGDRNYSVIPRLPEPFDGEMLYIILNRDQQIVFGKSLK